VQKAAADREREEIDEAIAKASQVRLTTLRRDAVSNPSESCS
jgi:hypothetical protein